MIRARRKPDRPYPRTMLDERLEEARVLYEARLEKARSRRLPLEPALSPGLVAVGISLIELQALGALIGRNVVDDLREEA